MAKQKTVKIRPIRRKGLSTLVEWTDKKGKLRRSIVPSDTVINGQVDYTTLEMGIPYGVEWSEFVQINATPERIQDELYRHGIWTVEDLQAKLNEARGVFLAVYGADLTGLLARSKQAGKSPATVIVEDIEPTDDMEVEHE